MSFGLCNALSSFQATMNSIFKPYLRHFIIVFFDDILIYSRTLDKHCVHLEKAFQALKDSSFFLKQPKCSFTQRMVEYLGHIASAQGVEPVQAKVQVIQEWPTLQSFKSLWIFLGFSGFYLRFIRSYAAMATPLTSLLTKGQFEWTPTTQLAIEKSKTAISTTPVLFLPNFSLPFILEIDFSLAFCIKSFNLKLIHASAYVHELVVITIAVKKWRQYLLGHHFTILTEHRNLKELMTQVIQKQEQQLYVYFRQVHRIAQIV